MPDTEILVTMPRRGVVTTFFDEERVRRLESIGRVHWNEADRQLTPDELCRAIRGIDICITGWDSPCLDGAVMACADRLRLLAHTGGSVNGYVSDALYRRGVRVVSGNRVFAESVAEGTVAYMLAALRRIPHYSAGLAKGCWPQTFQNRGLLERSVGIVGYGMIAQYLVEMLAPFRCRVQVYSRHIEPAELQRTGMTKADLPALFAGCDIVSLHTGLTAATRHLITEPLLRSMKPGALLVNTARGAIVDEAALCRVLADRPDLTAVLDVYEQEPLPADHPLCGLPNVLLMPHQAGPTIDRRPVVADSLLDDIEAFLSGGALRCEISRRYAAVMTAR